MSSSSSCILISSIISSAASPTADIVIAENQYGSIAPIISPENSRGLRTFTDVCPVDVTKAPKRASATRVADPIAKPLPIAAVVLPAASNLSVIYLMLGSRPAISAIPPALSEIGPYPSMVSAMGNVESMPRAASAIPYM